MPSTTYQINGMTCGHCVNAVTEELSALDGVTDVQIALNSDGPSTATVTSARDLPMAEVRTAVDEAGYELIDD